MKYQCTHCNYKFNKKLLACPECGSDSTTGWSEDNSDYSNSGGYGEDDFDYDEYLENEFSSGGGHSPQWVRTVSIILLILLVLYFVLSGVF